MRRANRARFLQVCLRLMLLLGGGCGDSSAPLNPSVSPAAVPPAPIQTALSSGPNVLLITVDTLRADQLGCYGSDLGASPHIDEWARRSVVFERPIAAAATTVPAHAAIMTSRFTRQHSVGWRNGSTRLTGSLTLAEAFRAAGYDTGAVISNMVLRKNVGLDRGFDMYDDDLPAAERNREYILERIAEQTTRRSLEWLAQRGGVDGNDTPFFLWVHYQDPHGPYTPPADYRDAITLESSEGEEPLPVLDNNTGWHGIPAYQAIDGLTHPSEYRARYASEIRYADEWIGRLLQAVGVAPGEREVSQRRETIVLLTSDHGESLGEGRFYFVHAYSPMPVLAHVPMILSAPGLSPGRRSEIVSHVDIMPTLLELAGVEAPEAFTASGLALGPLLRSGHAVSERLVYSDLGLQVGVYRDDRVARVLNTWKPWGDDDLAAPEKPLTWLTFEWQPGSTPTLVADDAEMQRIALRYIEHAVPMTRTKTLEKKDRVGLRALGYLVD